MPVAVRSQETMEHKTISISSKRQVTIPQKYFDQLGFESEAECILRSDGILIRPIKHSSGEFAEQILADLIAQGYSGDALLEKFKAYNRQIRPAVEKLIVEADEIAQSGESINKLKIEQKNNLSKDSE